MQFLDGFYVSLGCGLLAFLARTISLSGIIGGVIFGTIIYGCTGWQGFLVPLTFFIIGSLCTKIGYKKKAAMGIAQEEGGKRGAKHALANILAGTIFAVLSMIFYEKFLSLSSRQIPLVYQVFQPIPELQTPRDVFGYFYIACYAAMIGSFATAAADTSSSELGQVYGKTPINPLTFRRVKPGTEGAISMEGTLFGILAALIVALVGVSMGTFVNNLILSEVLAPLKWPFLMFWIFAIVTGAFLGNLIESIVGAAGGKKINNELLNFLNTLIGGVLSGSFIYAITHYVFTHFSGGCLIP